MEFNTSEKLDTDIAVIGMACRFPGAKTVEEFWENLKFGKETIYTFSDDELEKAGIDIQLIDKLNYVKRRGILEDIEYFDADFFGIPPYEASITDPQHKIFLEICWEALEKAGYLENKSEIAIGVFAGASDNTYYTNFLEKNREFLKKSLPYQTSLLNSNHFLTTRVSYLLNLKGPSISIATACSTSLVAIIQACQSLTSRDCDVALAGGVTIRVPQTQGYLHKEGSIYSLDGRCCVFDEKASGTVPSNGAGVVVLKRLTDAIRDGDNIDAVIKSYAINNDGNAKAGYTAPSVIEQTRCIASALANIDNVENIAHVEAHGTGTVLGDPIEVAALSKAFEFYTQKKNFCALGSVKANIGHTDVAAGIAGFIKSVLLLKNKTIPPSLNFNNANRRISFTNSPFYVCTQCKPLDNLTSSLRVGISSFGIGGTNTHIILGEAPKQQTTITTKPSYLILLSAKTLSAITQQRTSLLSYLNQHKTNDEELANIAYMLQVGRKNFEHRIAIVCSGVEHLKQLLQAQGNQNIVTNKGNQSSIAKIVFMFQGQGNLYKKCARDLYDHLMIFRNYFEECCAYLNTEVRKKILDYAVYDNNICGTNVKEPLLQQLITFIIEYSLAKTFITYGIQPDIVLGHSLGEYAAFCIAEVISLKDAINLVSLRAELTSKLPPGLMLSVPICVDKIIEYIETDRVSIAAINSPDSCVISGPPEMIKKLQDLFDTMLMIDHKKCTILNIPYAFHSIDVEKITEEYLRALKLLTLGHPSIPIMTTVSGEILKYEQIIPESHFIEHLRKPVLFSKCIKNLINNSFNIFLEIGVGQALSSLVKQHQDDLVTIFSLPREKDCIENKANQFTYFNYALGSCWTNYINIDWAAYYANEKKYRIALPTYPFEKKYCWLNPINDVTAKIDKGPCIYEPYWEVVLPNNLKTFDKKETWLIFVDNFGVADKLITKLIAHKQLVIQIKMGDFFKQLNDSCYQINLEDKNDYKHLITALISQNKWPNQIIHSWSLSKKNVASKQILKNGFFSLINFFQAVANNNQLPFYLTVITNNLKPIYHTDYIIPEKSTMLGLCLALPQETSTLARIIDTDIISLPSNKQNDSAEAILNETIFAPTDSIIIHRNNLRFVNGFKRYEATKADNDPKYLKQQGVYVLIGGFGKIGLALAEFLAKNYKAHLILISRSALLSKKDKEPRIVELGKNASSLRFLQADASDYHQMYSAFNLIKKEFSKIDGVFHLAAVLNFSTKTLIKDLQDEQAYEQFKPKIDGIKILAKLVCEITPRFCAVFSSLSAVIGGLGLCSYAASNCGLDSLIEYYQHNIHTRWIGINWDAWVDSEHKNGTNRSVLTFDEGFKLLQVCLNDPRGGSRFIVASDNLNALKREWVNYQDIKTIITTTSTTKELIHTNVADTNVELILKQLFVECLGEKNIGDKDDFYEIGGDSLSLLRLYELVNKKFPGAIKLADLVHNRTVCTLGEFLKNKFKPPNPFSCLVKLKNTGEKQPLFLLHPVGGAVFCYLELVKYLSIDHQVIAIQYPLLESDQISFNSIENMADYYMQAIQSVQNNGHYLIGGYSFGANVAFEIVRQLEQQGKEATLFIIDGWAKYSDQLRDRQKNFNTMKQIVEETSARIPNFIHSKDKLLNLLWNLMEMLFKYYPKKIKSLVILFKAKEVLPEYEEVDELTNHWQNYSQNTINMHIIDGNHLNILDANNSKQIAVILNRYLSA